MPNIIFKLHNGDQIKVTEQEFLDLKLSEILVDNTRPYIDMGITGFQKGALLSWGPEEIKETEVPVQ